MGRGFSSKIIPRLVSYVFGRNARLVVVGMRSIEICFELQ